jgi:hypothetical protein
MKDGYKKLNSLSLERTKKGPLRIASIRVGGSPERVMRIKKKKKSSIKYKELMKSIFWSNKQKF